MPETGEFLILGLVAVAVVVGAFLLSLVVRFRNLRRDMKTLEDIASEG